MHSQDVAKTMRASDAVQTLAAEKEELVVEKHQLTDELNRLKKELKESNKQWKMEQEDLKKIIAEKSKLIEDNSAISGRLQTEMSSLKSQVRQRETRRYDDDAVGIDCGDMGYVVTNSRVCFVRDCLSLPA